jgi:hypothetical protein
MSTHAETNEQRTSTNSFYIDCVRTKKKVKNIIFVPYLVAHLNHTVQLLCVFAPASALQTLLANLEAEVEVEAETEAVAEAEAKDRSDGQRACQWGWGENKLDGGNESKKQKQKQKGKRITN